MMAEALLPLEILTHVLGFVCGGGGAGGQVAVVEGHMAVMCVVASFVCRRWRAVSRYLAVRSSPGREQSLGGLQQQASDHRRLVHLVTLAAGLGWLSVVQWLVRVQRWPALDMPQAVLAAASSGHRDVLVWLTAFYVGQRTKRGQHVKPIVDAATCAAAARGGHAQLVRWLRAKGCPWDETTTNAAAEGGHLELVKWAHANGCGWSTATCAAAARGGQLAVLEWLRTPRRRGWATVDVICPWNERTCSAAAGGGHLHVLEWARSQGCPWDEVTCSAAASAGHLDILRWARERGCPGDLSQVASAAAQNGHLNVIEYCAENTNELDQREMCKQAAMYGHVHLLEWVQARYSIRSEVVVAAASKGEQLDVLRWCESKGWLADSWLLKLVTQEAVKNCRIEILEWLRDRNYEWSSNDWHGVRHRAVNGFMLLDVTKLQHRAYKRP